MISSISSMKQSCQNGISRSATMVIALVMRAAAERRSPEVWALPGMQAAYAFVKDKSPHVGPNMSYVIFPIALLHRHSLSSL